MTCEHQFFKFYVCDKKLTPESVRPIYGVKVGCVLCGEVRQVWESGDVNVLIKGREQQYVAS